MGERIALQIEQFEESTPYFNFINSIKSRASKKVYQFHLNAFIQYYQLDSAASIISFTADELRDRIVKYFLDKKHFRRSTQSVALAAIKHFCEMNDIILNWKKINKFALNSDIPKLQNRAYTHEEVKQVVDYCDHRIRTMFLFLASTGVRIGALRNMKIKDLVDKGQIYQVKVYPGENEEYITFTTPECKVAIDNYLDFRKRNGELITPDSYLFVQQYNKFKRIRAKPFANKSIDNLLQLWLVNSGVRTVDPVNPGGYKDVQRLHGFRKFFTKQLVDSKVGPEIREMLLGHNIGLAGTYYKPTNEDIQSEYEKAIDALTIDPANRLRKKVEKLEVEKTQIEALALELEKVKKVISKR
jgi:integrase